MREHGSLKLGGGGDIQETMGFSNWVGGYMREHGSLKLGGGYTRDHGSLRLGGRIYERTWVSKARWEDI